MRLRCCVADRRKETDKANPLLLLMLASLLSKPSIALSILPTTQREQREREALMTSIQEHWRCSCLESSRAYRPSREKRQRSMRPPPAEEEAEVLLLFLSLFSPLLLRCCSTPLVVLLHHRPSIHQHLLTDQSPSPSPSNHLNGIN